MSFAARSLPPSDRDEPRTAEIYVGASNANDFFLGLSHEIFMIGHDSKQLRDAFTHALNCSVARRPDQLRLAMSAIRTRADAIKDKTAKVEKMLAEHMGAKS